MKKTAKILSLFIAVAMIAALLPSFAFAAGEIVADFSSTDGITYNGGTINSMPNNTAVNNELIVTNGFSFDFSNMKSATARSWQFYKNGAWSGDSKGNTNRIFRMNIPKYNYNSSGWLADVKHSDYANTSKLAFTVPVTTAGWYDVSVDKVDDPNGYPWYVYVNGEYVGIYDNTKTGTTSYNFVTDGTYNQKLGSVYLPAGNASVVFALPTGGNGSGYDAYITLYRFILTPGSDAGFDKFETANIPDTMEIGEKVNISAKALLKNGKYHVANGYSLPKAEENDDLKIAATSGSSVTVTETNKHDGDDTATATLEAVAGGTTTVTVSAIIGGETKTFSKTITVKTAPVEDPIVANFTSQGITYNGAFIKSMPNNVSVTNSLVEPNGFSFDATQMKSATARVTNAYFDSDLDKAYVAGQLGTGTDPGGKGRTQIFRMDVAKYNYGSSGWLNDVKKSDYANSSKLAFTVPVAAAGWYDVSIDRFDDPNGCLWYVYVNGEYVGTYDNTKKGTEDFNYMTDGTYNQKLGSVYLAAGNASVVFALPEGQYDGSSGYRSFLSLYRFILTPGSDASFDKFEVTGTVPTEMTVGESFNISAKALLKDSTYHEANGLSLPKAEENDDLKIAATGDALSINQSDVHGGTDTATATVTAAKAGTTTLTVSAIIGGETKTKSYSINVLSNEPGEEVDGSVNVYVGAEAGGTVSATGCTANEVDEVDFGTEITATATANTGYGFAYWRNTAGTVLSTEESYTFKANGNTSVIAVFDAVENPSAETTTLEFWNGNGGFIEKKTVTKGATFASAKISAPSITGYVFDKWSVEDTDTIDMLTRAVAQFKESDAAYTVYVNGSPVMTGKKYGEEVTVESNNASFAAWKLGNSIISYDKSYTFYVWGDVYLTEAEGTAEDAVPTVGIAKFDGTNFICYNVPEGYTKVEAGLLFSKSGTPTISSFYSKAVAKESKSYGQFTAVPSDDESTARAYLIFKCNGSGETRVIYADLAK